MFITLRVLLPCSFWETVWQPILVVLLGAAVDVWKHKLARVCTCKRMRTRHSKRRLHAIAGNLELIMWAGS